MIQKKKKKNQVVFWLDHSRIKFQEFGQQRPFAPKEIVLTVMFGLGLN